MLPVMSPRKSLHSITNTSVSVEAIHAAQGRISADYPDSTGERLNLTIRQGSAYLGCRTICQARWKERLEDHLELSRCYYNFIRPHRALKLGRAVRTPAMQAGLTRRRLTLRKIFSSRVVFRASNNGLLELFDSVPSVKVAAWRMAPAASQHLMTQAP